MEGFLEILKYVLPSLVVMGTAYYILKKFLDAQYRKEVLDYRKTMSDQKLPLKLQAYERLMLFCERIDINNLLYRLLNSEMTGEQLAQSLIVAIQKEYEHNLAQQLYVSDNLWRIIDQAKNNVLELITSTSSNMGSNYTSSALTSSIQRDQETASQSLAIAKKAIREEVQQLLG